MEKERAIRITGQTRIRASLCFLVIFTIFTGCIGPFAKKKTDDTFSLLLAVAGLQGYPWNLPPGFPVPSVPADNPMTAEKVALGRYLFYDRRLSGNQTQSCATCHQQALAFSDGRGVGLGSTGELHPRSPQHLSNAAYHTRVTWAKPSLRFLEDQIDAPLLGTGPVELGFDSSATEATLRLRFSSDSIYQEWFPKAFGEMPGSLTLVNVKKAIAAFERTMISGNSAYDRYVYRGDASGMNASALRGAGLFFGERGDCFHCHGGFNFTDTSFHNGSGIQEFFYHSNGIYSDAEYSAMTAAQKGVFQNTGLTSDIGRFRAPSLRNVAVTYPYMHDGSFACDAPPPAGTYTAACARNALAKVVAHYNSGGKTQQNKDTSLVRPRGLTAQEQSDIVEFLMTLTDDEFLTSSRFSNPEPSNSNFGN